MPYLLTVGSRVMAGPCKNCSGVGPVFIDQLFNPGYSKRIKIKGIKANFAGTRPVSRPEQIFYVFRCIGQTGEQRGYKDPRLYSGPRELFQPRQTPGGRGRTRFQKPGQTIVNKGTPFFLSPSRNEPKGHIAGEFQFPGELLDRKFILGESMSATPGRK